MTRPRSRTFDPNPEFARPRAPQRDVTDFSVNADTGHEDFHEFDSALQQLKKVLLVGAACLGAVLLVEKMSK